MCKDYKKFIFGFGLFVQNLHFDSVFMLHGFQDHIFGKEAKLYRLYG